MPPWRALRFGRRRPMRPLRALWRCGRALACRCRRRSLAWGRWQAPCWRGWLLPLLCQLLLEMLLLEMLLLEMLPGGG